MEEYLKIDAKLDMVLAKFSDLDKRFAVIEERDKVMKERVDIHEERHESSEKFQIQITTERSNILTVAKVVGWVVGIAGGGTAFVIMLVNFFSK